MDKCIEMAKVYGIGMASIKHSNHFGMSASFVLQAARQDMMSLVFTNSSPAVSVKQSDVRRPDEVLLTP
jgi:LDH2 family malate/lactate/ureidoglycolate dehydrogenase